MRLGESRGGRRQGRREREVWSSLEKLMSYTPHTDTHPTHGRRESRDRE